MTNNTNPAMPRITAEAFHELCCATGRVNADTDNPTVPDLEQLLIDLRDERESDVALVLKACDRLARVARIALRHSAKLDDKVRFAALEKIAQNTRCNWRLHFFEWEDAIGLASQHPERVCPTCNHTVPEEDIP